MASVDASSASTGSTMDSNVFEVESIVDMRLNEADGTPIYRVRWKGYGPDGDTWEPLSNLLECRSLLDAYHEKERNKTSIKNALLTSPLSSTVAGIKMESPVTLLIKPELEVDDMVEQEEPTVSQSQAALVVHTDSDDDENSEDNLSLRARFPATGRSRGRGRGRRSPAQSGSPSVHTSPEKSTRGRGNRGRGRGGRRRAAAVDSLFEKEKSLTPQSSANESPRARGRGAARGRGRGSRGKVAERPKTGAKRTNTGSMLGLDSESTSSQESEKSDEDESEDAADDDAEIAGGRYERDSDYEESQKSDDGGIPALRKPSAKGGKKAAKRVPQRATRAATNKTKQKQTTPEPPSSAAISPPPSVQQNSRKRKGKEAAGLRVIEEPVASDLADDMVVKEAHDKTSNVLGASKSQPVVLVERVEDVRMETDDALSFLKKKADVKAASKPAPTEKVVPPMEKRLASEVGDKVGTVGASTSNEQRQLQEQQPIPKKSHQSTAETKSDQHQQLPKSKHTDVVSKLPLPVQTNLNISEFFKQEMKFYQNEQGRFMSPTEFGIACKSGNAAFVRSALIAAKKSPKPFDCEQTDKDGTTLLMQVASRGCDPAHEYDDILELLVQFGANVNARNESGATALFIAAEKGFLCKVSKLLSLGASANLPNNQGDTALIVACKRGVAHVVYRLLEYGADFNATNLKQESALSLAEASKQNACVAQLKEHTNKVRVVFEQELQVVLGQSVKLKRFLFPMHCYSLNESTTFRVMFNFEPFPFPKERDFGFMLFIGVAKFSAQAILAKFFGPCPVLSVTLNGTPQVSFQEDANFVLSCWPIQDGLNELIIRCVNAKNSQAKLLIQAFFVQVRNYSPSILAAASSKGGAEAGLKH